MLNSGPATLAGVVTGPKWQSDRVPRFICRLLAITFRLTEYFPIDGVRCSTTVEQVSDRRLGAVETSETSGFRTAPLYSDFGNSREFFQRMKWDGICMSRSENAVSEYSGHALGHEVNKPAGRADAE